MRVISQYTSYLVFCYYLNMDNSSWIFPLVSFVVGILVGFFGGRLLDRSKAESNVANTFVLVIVVLIWATSVIVDILSPNYETSPLIHGLMGAIVGFFFKPWQGITFNPNQKPEDKKDK